MKPRDTYINFNMLRIMLKYDKKHRSLYSPVGCNIAEFFAWPCKWTINDQHLIFNIEHAIRNPNRTYQFSDNITTITQSEHGQITNGKQIKGSIKHFKTILGVLKNKENNQELRFIVAK